MMMTLPWFSQTESLDGDPDAFARLHCAGPHQRDVEEPGLGELVLRQGRYREVHRHSRDYGAEW